MIKNNNFKITTAQLAKICGVSQGTVDRALNNRPGINSATKAHILEKATEYGYLTAPEKESLIGLIVFDLYNEYFSSVVMEMERAAKSAGSSSVVMFSYKNKSEEIECIRRLYHMGVTGIALYPVNYGEDFSAFITSLNIPVVCIGNMVENANFVGTADFNAMYEATLKAASTGKKLIYFSPALLYTNTNIYAQKQRFSGFRAAVEELGTEYLTACSDRELSENYTSDDYYIICSTDYYALRAAKLTGSNNISGFDCIPAISGTNISTIKYSYSEIADISVSMLKNKDFNAKRIVRYEYVMNP